MAQLWAHSVNDDGRRHLLADHLQGTSVVAREFADPFGGGALAAHIGLVHDVGKGRCAWQERLLAVESAGGDIGLDHKRAGTWLAFRSARLGPFAAAVAGHHGGLPSVAVLQRELALAEGQDRAAVEEAVTSVKALVPGIVPAAGIPRPTWLDDPLTDPVAAELLVRMVFSAVVDADFLDTERHFRGEHMRRVTVPAGSLTGCFEQRRRAYLAQRCSPVGELRDQAYAQAVAAARLPPGMFRMPAATGAGKTIMSAGFGLHHADRHGMRRVIVAVPYMSITEQNASVYRDLLGEEHVLEHHSGVDLDRLSTGQRWQKLAAENWDAPFIITTTVQLFESLFSNRPAAMRKLHRLAGSVIVLDEVQALPDDLLMPILSGLRHLTEYFGSTVLLASATQPEFWSLPPFRGLPVRDVLTEPERLYRGIARLRNLRYQWWTDPKPTLEQIAQRVAGEPQCLLIVNTTADAARLHARLETACTAGAPVLHLSRRMASAHLQHTLRQVTGLLKAGLPVTVVSTTLVEAGVDLDFPLVLRAFSAADSILQAAGRCNRECRRTGGLVIVFDPADGSQGTSRIYGAALPATSEYFGPGKASLDDRDALARYYRRRYSLKNIEHASRGVKIQELRAALNFPEVAAIFRMIDDSSCPVVTPYGEQETERERKQLLGMLRSAKAPPAWAYRRLRPYLASLPASHAQRAVEMRLAVPVVGDLIEWRADYHQVRGIEFPPAHEQENPA